MKTYNKLKVAIFTGTINLQRENADVRRLYITERLKHFPPSEIQLEILTPQMSKLTAPQLNNVKYNMFRFKNKKHLKVISSLLYSSNKLIKLDCELLHCYTHQAAIIAWLMNHFRRRKYLIIFEPMGLAYEESKLQEKSSIKAKLFGSFIKLGEKFIFKQSDAVAVYTNLLKRYVSEEFDVAEEKVYVIPHGVDLNIKYNELDNSEKISELKKLNISEKNKVVLYAGSLSKLHGTSFLIETVNYVSRKKDNVSFLILGKGALENKLRCEVKENGLTNVNLLGFVSPKKISFYLSLADVLLIPHAKCMQTELDLPTKLFEYLASGKPTVSFNLKAIAEITNGSVILVNPDDPQALGDGILALLDDVELCNKLGEKGKTIVKEYSWEVSAKRQYDLYKCLYESRYGN